MYVKYIHRKQNVYYNNIMLGTTLTPHACFKAVWIVLKSGWFYSHLASSIQFICTPIMPMSTAAAASSVHSHNLVVKALKPVENRMGRENRYTRCC